MKNNFLSVTLAMVLILSAGLVGCGKKKDLKAGEDGIESSVSDGSVDSGAASSDNGNAMGLQTVFFAYDSSDLSDEGKAAIANNINVMKENSSLKVQIEGHCDERGGIQYNLALGEKRANAVKQAVTKGGISSARVTTISFGKEHPLVPGSSEEAWSKNRRGNFVITTK
jgi:peptidoglycan-associated lipoprotein